MGREIHRLISSKEANTRPEQVVWKECMFLTVVNTIFGLWVFWVFFSSGVTGSSKTLVPSAECFSKVFPAGTW